MKTVAFVVGTLSCGGAERFVSHALQALDREQFAPSLVLFRPSITYPVPPDIPVMVLEKYNAWHSFRTIWRLHHWLREMRPDIVFSAWSVPGFFVAASLLGLPARRRPHWIARIANDPVREETGLYHLVMRWLYRRAHILIANSQGVAQGFSEHYPNVQCPIRVVPNPVDLAALRAQSQEPGRVNCDNRPTVVAVGRLFKQKRYDVLLRAFHRVRQHIDARLVICGDGPLRNELAGLVIELGLSDAVQLEGFVANPYVWMKAADLFVMTSDHEGLPNALLEAQALGIPAVATDCRFGPSEIIEPGRTGILVEQGDIAGMADAIVSLLRTPERRFSMGKAAEQRIRDKYEIKQVMNSLMGVLRESSSLEVA